MHPVIKNIREELNNKADPVIRKSTLRFFKEDIQCYGLKSADVKFVATKYWKEVRPLSKKDIFELSEQLLQSDMMEEARIVIIWLPKLKNKFEEKDLSLFKKWIGRYINNWAKCDGFCNHTVGDFLQKFPGSINEIKSWAHSKNRWMKRASAVSLIVPARQGEFLNDIFEIAHALLTDPDDIVQKGYGWLLKVASLKHEKEVFEFVMEYRSMMPRTALRYAIEKMDPELRILAMKKGN